MRKKMFMLGLGFLVAFAFTTEAFAKEKTYRWKIATSWPSTLTPLASPAINFAKMVEEMSGGRLKVRVHGAEKHKAPLGVLDMVKAGNYEMGHSASYYWKGKDINTPLFTSMPFMFTVDELYAWFYHGGGLELMKKVYDKHGVYSYPGGNTGVQMGGWFRKEIKSVDDLKGLKMRIPGYAGEVMAKLGVIVTNIAAGELYTALERGSIDALEWVGPGMDIRMGFNKIAPYYYKGWHEPASDTQFLINIKKFKKLPKDLQAIVKVAMEACASRMYYESYEDNANALADIKKNYPNVKIKELPMPVLKAMKKSNDELIAEMEKKGGLTQEIIQSQRAYLKKVRDWSNISEFSYIKNMNALEE